MGLWKKPTGPQMWSLYRRGWALWWDLGGRGGGGGYGAPEHLWPCSLHNMHIFKAASKPFSTRNHRLRIQS